jgi:hypothetical protein
MNSMSRGQGVFSDTCDTTYEVKHMPVAGGFRLFITRMIASGR